MNAERRKSTRTVQGQVGELPWEIISEEPQPEHLAALHELIEDVINSFESDQRQVAVLTFQGLSAKEISETLSMSLRNVQLIRSTIEKSLRARDGS